MVPLYLDECLSDVTVARQLRTAGHLVYVTTDVGAKGQPDEAALESATGLGAVLATQNQGDFTRLHRSWESGGRTHAGILLTRQLLELHTKIERLERAARLLTPEVAANQLMRLDHLRPRRGA